MYSTNGRYSIVRKKLMENKLKRYDCLILVLLDLILLCPVFYPYIFQNKVYSSVYNLDAIVEYFPIYKNVVSSMINGTFSWWNFNVSTGNSMWTYSSYVLDPFISILLIFHNNILFGMAIAQLLKIVSLSVLMYFILQRLSFSRLYCLIGGVLYAFNGYVWAWFWGPQFSTFFVLFSIVVLCLELYIKSQKNWLPLILSLFFMLVNSLYFSFMASLFFVIYAIIRVFLFVSVDVNKFQLIGKLILVYLIALCLSMFSLLPVFDILINSPRTHNSISLPFLSINVLFESFLSLFTFHMSHYTVGVADDFHGYITVLFPFLLVIFFLNWRNILMHRKTLFTLCLLIVPLTFPVVALLFSNFAQYNFRFTFFYPFLEVIACMFILRNTLEKNLRIVILFSFLCCCSVVFLLELENAYLILVFLSCYCVILMLKNSKVVKLVLIFVVVIIECLTFAYFESISTNHDDSIQRTVNFSEMFRAAGIKDNDFYRVTKNYYLYGNNFYQNFGDVAVNYLQMRENNDSLLLVQNGFSSYYSLQNTAYLSFLTLLDQSRIGGSLQIYEGEEDINLSTLLSAKYAYTKGNLHPFGYSLVKQQNGISMFKNNNFLSVARFYSESECINSQNIWTEPREQIISNMYNHYYSPYCDDITVPVTRVIHHIDIKHTLVHSNIKALFESSNSMNYVVENHDFNFPESINYPEVTISVKTTGPTYIRIYVNNDQNPITRFVGVGTKPLSISIDYTNIKTMRVQGLLFGGRSVDDLQVGVLNMISDSYNNYTELVNLAKRRAIDTVYDSSNQSFSLLTSNLKNGIIIFYIPFDKFWHAKVNGQSINIEQSNVGFIGVPVKAGSNHIELYYRNDYYIIGLIISVITALGICVFYVYKRAK